MSLCFCCHCVSILLSMYVWCCPHHDNPSLPAEGKQKRSYNAGPPVALPLSLIFFLFSLSGTDIIITLTAPRRLKLCLCVYASLFAAWRALRALWEEKRGIGYKTRDKGRRVFLCFQNDAESEQHVRPLWL